MSGDNRYLPAQPLVDFVERLPTTLTELVRSRGISDINQVDNWRNKYAYVSQVGRICERSADEFCCDIFHVAPQSIWGEAWWGESA